MRLSEPRMRIDIKADCSGGTGPDLSAYPHLVYAPRQWGDGVRCGSNGAAVEVVAADAATDPIQAVAARHGVTIREVLDALCYAQANGLT